jgi:hypothetical protein
MNVGSIFGKALGAIAPLAMVFGPAGAAIGAGLGIVSAGAGAAQQGTQQPTSPSNAQDASSMGFEF